MLADGGNPDRSILMSEPMVAIALVAVLLPPDVAPPLTSLMAPVVTETVVVPAPVGVPLTGQLMLEPAATDAGGSGEHAQIGRASCRERV